MFRHDSLMVGGGSSRARVGDCGEGGGCVCGVCDSEVVSEEEECCGCDDCDSRSVLGEEDGDFDGSCGVVRCQSWDKDAATQRKKSLTMAGAETAMIAL